MSALDERLKARAGVEDCPVPEGFDGRLEAVLRALPETGRRRVRPRVLRTLLAAAVICVACLISVLALSPSLRSALDALLGSFAPYSRAVEGVSATDNGIRVRILSTVADQNDGMVYFEVTDLTDNRLDGGTAFDYLWNLNDAYDPETRTALFSKRLFARDRNDDGTATISIGAFLPGVEAFKGIKLPWELVTDQRLDTMTVEEVEGETGRPALVLKPEQTPAELNTELLTLSSMGFDSRGDFHVQIALADGVELPKRYDVYTKTLEGEWSPNYEDRNFDTLVIGDGRYLDIVYEGFTIEHFGQFRVDDLGGTVYTRPAIKGDWTLSFPLEILPERIVHSEERLQGMKLATFHISAMTLWLETVFEDPDDPGYLGAFPVCLFCRDGTVLGLEYTDHDMLYTDEDGNVKDGGGLMSGVHHGGKQRYGERYLWNFPRAVDPQEVIGISIGLRYIPMEGDAAGEGLWLEELPR